MWRFKVLWVSVKLTGDALHLHHSERDAFLFSFLNHHPGGFDLMRLELQQRELNTHNASFQHNSG